MGFSSDWRVSGVCSEGGAEDGGGGGTRQLASNWRSCTSGLAVDAGAGDTGGAALFTVGGMSTWNRTGAYQP